MHRLLHHLFNGPASPFVDRFRLMAGPEGRTAADDLADYGVGAGSDDDGSIGVETPEEGTLAADIQDFNLEQGYQDDPPESFDAGDPEPPQPHDYRKRYADTKTALEASNAEKAALKAQLEVMAQQRQPSQPNVLQPGQTDDAIAQIDREYQQQKAQLTKSVMAEIKHMNRQDPLAQQKVAELWATHQERLVELDGDRRERRAQYAQQAQSAQQQYFQREATRALTQAGLDASLHDKFVDQVAVLNFRQPGWDHGMAPAQTFDYVANLLKERGVAPVNSNPTQQQQLTPQQQHDALRRGARGGLKAGARLDPTKPTKKVQEEKDVSWHEQMRQHKRSRIVTQDQAMRMKQR